MQSNTSTFRFRGLNLEILLILRATFGSLHLKLDLVPLNSFPEELERGVTPWGGSSQSSRQSPPWASHSGDNIPSSQPRKHVLFDWSVSNNFQNQRQKNCYKLNFFTFAHWKVLHRNAMICSISISIFSSKSDWGFSKTGTCKVYQLPSQVSGVNSRK